LLTIVNILTQEQSSDLSQGLDDVLLSCIRWPLRNRNGQSIDNTSFLSKILRILEANASNPPGFHVWKQLVVECAKRARQNVSRWELVQRVLKKLSTDNPQFWPDHLLLKYGLDASEFLLDSELASTLIVRTLEHDRDFHAARSNVNNDDDDDAAFESDLFDLLSDSKQYSFGITARTETEEESIGSLEDGSVRQEWAEGSSFDETKSTEIDVAADKSMPDASLELPPVQRSRVVFQDILKGMEICVHSSDMRSGRAILDSVEAFPEAVPAVGKRALYSLALKGFAAIGDFESAEQLLSTMIQNDIKPG
jgi:pentatricopeptide repeat protein